VISSKIGLGTPIDIPSSPTCNIAKSSIHQECHHFFIGMYDHTPILQWPAITPFLNTSQINAGHTFFISCSSPCIKKEAHSEHSTPISASIHTSCDAVWKNKTSDAFG
jgi:hypothetical protein